MDKLTIVMSNYIDVECDANTTPRQAYERGFRRAAEKCETVMRSRKAKNDALRAENAKLREQVTQLRDDWESERDYADQMEAKEKRAVSENAKLRELVRDMFEEIEAGGFDPMVERHGKSIVYYDEDPSWRVGIRERIRELGIEV